MKNSTILFNLLFFLGISFIITIITYGINLIVFSNSSFSPTDILFIEGLCSLILGFLLLLGRGGINLWSQKAAILSSIADALFGRGTLGPRESFRRDAWKAKGFTRIALILIIAGVFMLIIYFLNL